jgi:multidrug resistance efflux pump
VGASQQAAIQASADEVLHTLQAGLQRLQATRKQAEKNLERTAGSLQVRGGAS